MICDIKFRVCETEFNGWVEADNEDLAIREAALKIMNTLEFIRIEPQKKTKLKTGTDIPVHNFLK